VTFEDLPAVERAFASMAAALSQHEHVEILLPDEDAAERASHLLVERGARHACLHPLKTADVWIRDYGPTFVVRRAAPRKAYVRWMFNAWGGKYDALLADDGVPDRLRLGMPRFAPPIVMEGGSLDVNGAGSVLTTEQCLLHRNRNPGLNRSEIESWLRAYLGVVQVLWLARGIAGDDTDGHVDDVARFVGPRTIVTAYEEDRSDENFEPLDDAWRRLVAMADPQGRPFEVVRLPMPGRLMAGRRRLPASYANFYVGNRTVLLPVYGPRARDERAARILRRCFPGRAVVPVDARALVYGYGSIHCATQQQPA
jgi:agmatine deiminase